MDNINMALYLWTRYHGNSFDDGAAPSLPPRTSPSPFHNNDHHSGSDSGCTHGIKGFTIGEFVDIILASVFLAIILLGLCCCFRMQQQEDRHARTSNRSLPLGTNNGEIPFLLFLIYFLLV